MGRQVHLAGIELATLAGPHDVGGVGDCGGPVKALSERVSLEGTWRSMVTANAGMDVPDQLPALRNGNASLQDA